MTPQFLVARAPSSAPGLDSLARRCAEVGGAVQAQAPADRTQALEPGTPAMATLIASLPSAEALRTVWREAGEPAGNGMLVLSVPGLPPAHMVIEGTAYDEEAIGRYRDVILPMMRERGSYYTVFELGGNVEVLAGEWDEAIFAISRWPTIAAARDFWYSERY